MCETMRQLFFARFALILVVSIVSPCIVADVCHAQLLYKFTDEDTGTVLVGLELATLPAEFSDIVELTFTPAGQAKLGYGLIYTGMFDLAVNGNRIFDTGNGRHGSASFFDNDPPNSAAIPTVGTARVNLSFSGPGVGGPEIDRIIVNSNDPRAEPSAVVSGRWSVVPEPSSVLLTVMAGLSLLTCRAR